MALAATIVLSGVPQEQFTGDLQMVFNQGTVLLKTPESSPPSSPRSTSPAESGISSLSTDTERSLDYYLDVIDQLEQRFLRFLEFPFCDLKYGHLNPKIMYENRNVLDLTENLNSEWTFQPAILQKGVNNFFQNRSQLSRLDGAELPPYKMEPCEAKDCSFTELVYL